MILLLKSYYIINVVNHERKTVKSYCCTSSGEALKRYFVTCTLLSLPWYEIKDVPIYRCKSFKFRTLGVKFRYI